MRVCCRHILRVQRTTWLHCTLSCNIINVSVSYTKLIFQFKAFRLQFVPCSTQSSVGNMSWCHRPVLLPARTEGCKRENRAVPSCRHPSALMQPKDICHDLKQLAVGCSATMQQSRPLFLNPAWMSPYNAQPFRQLLKLGKREHKYHFCLHW